MIPNMYRTTFVYVGIALHEHENFTARCILYGSSQRAMSSHRQLLRLLYILIGSGILLLVFIVLSIVIERRHAALEQKLKFETEMFDRPAIVMPKRSITALAASKERLAESRRERMSRATLGRLGSTVDERPSAVHSFF